MAAMTALHSTLLLLSCALLFYRCPAVLSSMYHSGDSVPSHPLPPNTVQAQCPADPLCPSLCSLNAQPSPSAYLCAGSVPSHPLCPSLRAQCPAILLRLSLRAQCPATPSGHHNAGSVPSRPPPPITVQAQCPAVPMRIPL